MIAHIDRSGYRCAFRAQLAIGALAGFVCGAAPAQAQVSIAPGQSANLGGSDPGGGPADGSSLTCTIGVVDWGCGFFTNFRNSEVDPAANLVVADHSAGLLNTGIGDPHVASAGIFDDFTIPGSSGDFVSVQFSVSYDLFVKLLGSAAYEVGGDLSLTVEDITTGTAEGIGAADLFKSDRGGDQGFTDLTTGQEVFRIYHGVGNLQLLLRRGRTYRVWFQAQSLSEQFVIGRTEVHAEATRRRLVVRVDEDEAELLAEHDSDVKQQLDRIEGKIDDINERLAMLARTQLEETLVAPRSRHLTILQTDRLDEVCEAAQQAIDSSISLGYEQKPRAQRLMDQASAVKASDPRRAVKLCRDAYRSAAFPSALE